jgi:hypothetical protein
MFAPAPAIIQNCPDLGDFEGPIRRRLAERLRRRRPSHRARSSPPPVALRQRLPSVCTAIISSPDHSPIQAERFQRRRRGFTGIFNVFATSPQWVLAFR